MRAVGVTPGIRAARVLQQQHGDGLAAFHASARPPLVCRRRMHACIRAGSFPPKDVTAEQVMFNQLQFATGESRLLR